MLRPADAKGLVVGETFNPWLKSGQVRRVGTRGENRKGKELEELECSRSGGMHVSVSLGVALLRERGTARKSVYICIYT